MADISEEEVINIANNFLLSSPPGEFLEVAIGMRNNCLVILYI